MSLVVEVERVDVAVGGRPVLVGVELAIAEREVVALLGANGVGKTTLLDVVLGLRAPRAGTVRVLGASPPSRDVGFVPQDPGAGLLPWLSVHDNVGLPLRLRGEPADRVEQAVSTVIARFESIWRIDATRRPDGLSGGERQLVALLRALVAAPRMLVCDEPFSALDAPARERLREVLRAVCADPHGPAMLLVSHDVEDVLSLADRALVLSGRPARITTEVDVRAPDARATLSTELRRS